MNRVQWVESMSIGVEEIDRQHKELLELVNETFAVVQRSDTNEQTEATLRRLCDYVIKHFASEEKLMDPETYEYYDQHLQEHIDCSMKALDFLAAFSAGNNVDLHEFLNFAVEWIKHHIQETDKTLGVFIAGKPAQ